ncbi:hypothetical protein [Saccharopolyspora taberi]|uniref:Uncharacterized protein n=1 Tax=Saccharopolyspora taberi TaxID=60895 RepID=A0ABN3VL53_9PSEU
MHRTAAKLLATAGISAAVLLGAAGVVHANEHPVQVLGVPSENPGQAILSSLGLPGGQ